MSKTTTTKSKPETPRTPATPPNHESRAAQASRENGKKSKGPTTPEGKQKSSRNGLKHGMLAQTVVLESESHARFDALAESLLLEHSPITESERALVQTMAVARWRQMRTWSVQKTDFDIEISRQDPGPAPVRAALAFRSLTDESRSLDVAHRYETTYERQFSRALRDLITLRSSRPRTNNLAGLPVAPSYATSTWDAEPEPGPDLEPDLESHFKSKPDTSELDDANQETGIENLILLREPVPTSEHSSEAAPTAPHTAEHGENPVQLPPTRSRTPAELRNERRR